MIHILYNPISNCGKNIDETLETLESILKNEEINFVNLIENIDMKWLFDTFSPSDDVIIVGGDGTLNVMVNKLGDYEIKNKLYLYKAGTGNDFLRDVEERGETSDFVQINKYIKNLPVVTVNDKQYRFINNVGFGIDGMVCTAAEDLKEKGKTDINYTILAIKLLLTKYKKCDAKVTVDGKVHKFKGVWLAPVMNGKYYGGGMMPCPQQDREGDTLSCCLIHDTTALRTLMIFPSIFKGEHIKSKKKVTVLSGKEFTVEYSAPQDVQIDGEIIRGVTKIRATK